VITDEGKTVLLTKDYKGSMDIVTAYKSLKHAVAKTGTGMSDNRASMKDGQKGYLKMTIAAQ
jgi:hypothetical protein